MERGLNMADILKELNVEKLNICEPDGRVKMTLFNSKNIPSLILEDEDLLPGHRANDGISGAMFYNNHGDECGGLIYGSNVDEDGNVNMGMSLTFDKWKQDQVLQLHLDKEGDREMYGISIYDRPNESIRHNLERMKQLQVEPDESKQKDLIKKLQYKNHRRVFVGKSNEVTTISLFDSKGTPKFSVYINDNDELVMKVNGEKVDLDKLL